MIKFLCSSVLVSVLFVPKLIDGGTSHPTFLNENTTFTITNDTSSFSIEKPSHPLEATHGSKGKQTRDIDGALEEAIAIEVFWFGYGE